MHNTPKFCANIRKYADMNMLASVAKAAEVKFICVNEWCEINEQAHYFTFPPELVMDEENIADMFCPKCQRLLKRID